MAFDRSLSPAEREIQARARSYVDDVLIPLELTAELRRWPAPR